MAIKKGSKNCKATISDRCGSKTPLTCTEYEGILPQGSQFDEDDCLTGEDIIEDIISILDDHTEQLDFSDFGCCLNYTPSDIEAGLQLKDILSEHESRICDLIENCSNAPTSSEDDCVDCENLTSNFIGLVYNTSGSGNVTIGASFTQFTAITSYDLKYKTKVKGKYKITLDLDYSGNTGSSELFSVGISIDGQSPEAGVFNQDTVKVANNSKTLHFVVEVDKGVTILPVFKKATTISVVMEKVKMIIEKV